MCSSLILCCGDWTLVCAGGEAAGDLVCETGEGGASSGCERFSFFCGGSCACSSGVLDFELERCTREAFGSCIPSEGSDSDLRRVLYGMMPGVAGCSIERGRRRGWSDRKVRKGRRREAL